MREAILEPRARAYYRLMSETEQASVEQCLARREHDPSPDGKTTFDVSGVEGLGLYDDGTWQVMYMVLDEATLAVLAITHALDLPN